MAMKRAPRLAAPAAVHRRRRGPRRIPPRRGRSATSSQPSLSAQVALAERQLGVQVFERDRAASGVSTAGAPIVDQARQVLVAARDLAELARQAADPFRGTLRLGVIPTVGPYLLPEVTPVLATAFPRSRDRLDRGADGRAGAPAEGGRARRRDPRARGRASAISSTRSSGAIRSCSAAAPGHPLSRARGAAHARHAERRRGAAARRRPLLPRPGARRLRAGWRGAETASGRRAWRRWSRWSARAPAVTLLPSLALPVENRRGQLRVRRFTSPRPGPHARARLAPRVRARPTAHHACENDPRDGGRGRRREDDESRRAEMICRSLARTVRLIRPRRAIGSCSVRL